MPLLTVFMKKVMDGTIAWYSSKDTHAENVPVQFPEAVLVKPVTHLHTKDPFTLTQCEFSVQLAVPSKHSFMSSKQVAPPHPGSHEHTPVSGLQLVVVSLLQVHVWLHSRPHVHSSQTMD